LSDNKSAAQKKLPLWYNFFVKLKDTEENINAKKDLSAENETPCQSSWVQAADVNR